MSGVDDQDIWSHYARGVKKLGEKEPEPVKAKRPAPLQTKSAIAQEEAGVFPSPLRGGTATKQSSNAPSDQIQREQVEQERLETLLPRGRAAAGSPRPFGARDDEGGDKKIAPIPAPSPWKKEPLDLRVERNMSMGDVVIEARLDLHGRTEQDAYDALKEFIETQHRRGKRMLLVITGKGADGASVLRANLPRWCTVPPFEDAVLAVRTAAPHHGGEGAYYVLLRKRA